MLKHLVFCCLITTFVSGAALNGSQEVPEEDDGRIIAGTKAKVGEFPYVVSLQYTDKTDDGLVRFCGGSILNTKFVLTAAHCVDEAIAKGKDFSIVAGALDSVDPNAKGRQRVKVQKTNIHPGWTKPTTPPFANDIAILELASPLKFNANVRSIQLPEAGVKFDGGRALIAGWGVIKEDKRAGNSFAPSLMRLDVPIIKLQHCRTLYYPKPNELEEYHICAGNVRGSACGGDSGGPLVLDVNNVPTVIGVTSFGPRPCGKTPFAYVGVSHYLNDFILPIIGKQ